LIKNVQSLRFLPKAESTKTIPANGRYAENGSLYCTDYINTDGSVERPYRYRYYCSGSRGRGHTGYGMIHPRNTSASSSAKAAIIGSMYDNCQ
jgi:hypothetical protein